MTKPKEQILETVKSEPHIKTRIRPVEYAPNESTRVSDLINFVESNAVKYRGWPFPHLDHTERVVGNDRVTAYNDFRNVNEYWVLTKSHQLVHYNTIREILEPNVWYNTIPTTTQKLQNLNANGFVDLKNTVWSIAERVIFASRLASHNPDFTSWSIEIELNGVNNFALLSSPSMNLFYNYICEIKDIAWRKSVTSSYLSSSARIIAAECSSHVLEMFGFLNPPDYMLGKMYDELLTL